MFIISWTTVKWLILINFCGVFKKVKRKFQFPTPYSVGNLRIFFKYAKMNTILKLCGNCKEFSQ